MKDKGSSCFIMHTGTRVWKPEPTRINSTHGSPRPHSWSSVSCRPCAAKWDTRLLQMLKPCPSFRPQVSLPQMARMPLSQRTSVSFQFLGGCDMTQNILRILDWC